MTARTAYPATESNGDTLTTTNFDKLPGGWIGYVEITASATGISSTQTITGLDAMVVTVNTSRRIQMTAGGQVSNDTNSGRCKVWINELAGATQRVVLNNDLAASAHCSFEGSVVKTPSAGSHTYQVSAAKASGIGTFDLAAAATDPGPAFLLIVDIGPA